MDNETKLSSEDFIKPYLVMANAYDEQGKIYINAQRTKEAKKAEKLLNLSLKQMFLKLKTEGYV